MIVARYILLFLTISFSIALSAQSDIASLTDSLYEEKAYEQLIKRGELHLSTEKSDATTTARLKYNLANSYYKVGDFVHCWRYIQEAFEDAQNIELIDTHQVETFVDVAQRLGDFCFQTESLKLGVDALQKGIDVAEKHLQSDAWRLAKLYHKIGALYRFMSQFDEAIAHLEIGQKLSENLDEERRNYIATVFLAEMAQVYNDNNQLNKSIAIFKEILKDANDAGNKKRQSIYNNNIAIAYRRKGDLGKAEYHLRKSLEAKLDLYGEKTPKIISNYTNLAQINGALGRNQAAERYYDKLDSLIAEVFEKDHPKNGDTHYNRGSDYYNQKKYNDALNHAQESVRIRDLHKSDNDLILGEAEYLLAATLTRLGRNQEAIPLLHTVLERRYAAISTQDTERKSILMTLYEAHKNLGKKVDAHKYLNLAYEAMNYSSEAPFAFDALENPQGLVDPLAISIIEATEEVSNAPTVQNMARGQDLHIVADSLIRYLKLKYDDVTSRRGAVSEFQKLNEALIGFNLALHQHTEDTQCLEGIFQIMERSNNTFLYEAIAEENSRSVFGISHDLINRKIRLQDSIALMHKKMNEISIDSRAESDEYATTLIKTNHYKKKLYDLIQLIETKHPNYFKSIYDPQLITLAQLQDRLSDNEVVITYFVGEKTAYGMSLSSDKIKVLNLGESIEIKSNISSLLEALNNKSYGSEYLTESKRLYRRIIKPFDIEEGQDITIIASDILGLLPFEILINEEDNLPLLLKHVITYQYSNTFMAAPKSKRRGSGAIVMAPIFAQQKEDSAVQNPGFEDRYRSELGYLPETEEEVKMVNGLYAGDVRLGAEASESAFKVLAPKRSLLHLATHGFVDHENPDFSRLYFSAEVDSLEDGMLHAHEIVNMNLSADLVTLSACNTGVGKVLHGEGVSSLGRAFAYANCPNQLISLWPANDKSTTQLMSLYYTNLKGGMGKSKALTEAKRQYLATTPDIYKHPHYWAGFIYYGQDLPMDAGMGIDYKYFVLGSLLTLFFLVWVGRTFRKRSA